MKRWLFVPFSILALSVACSTEDGAPTSACEGNDCAPAPGLKRLGEGCEASNECASALCVQVAPSEGAGGRVCSQDCSTQGCPVGWQCGSAFGRRACLCARQPEVCDGQDNDCDGVVDGPPANAVCGAAHEGEVCEGGRCTCLLRCGERCVDPRSDADHCGACGKSCGGFGACASGKCTCSAQAMLCDGACVVTTNDPKNCGACGTICGPGEACYAGRCECRLATCGGRCVDTTGDRMNCSDCGHACAGECRASTCAAQTLVTGQGKPDLLAASDTDLFWLNTDSGKIQRCPLADCQPSTVSTIDTISGVTAVAAAGRYAFWGNATSLRRYDGATGTVTTFASANVGAIAVDGAHVYFRDATRRTVSRCAFDGDCASEATTIASGLATGGQIAVAEGKLFILFARVGVTPGYLSSDSFGIHVCPSDGCPSSPPPFFLRRGATVGGVSTIKRFGVSHGRVLWTIGDSLYPFGSTARESCPVTGCVGDPLRLFDVDEFGVADGERVYWVETTTPSILPEYRLFSCSLSEQTWTDKSRCVQCAAPRAALVSAVPRVAAGGSTAAAAARPRSSLVVRGDFLYFAEPGGTIRRVEKL